MWTVQPFQNLFRIASGTRKPAPAANMQGTWGGRLLGDGGKGANATGCCGGIRVCCIK